MKGFGDQNFSPESAGVQGIFPVPGIDAAIGGCQLILKSAGHAGHTFFNGMCQQNNLFAGQALLTGLFLKPGQGRNQGNGCG